MKRGFTLVELLVVIAIIGILSSVVVVAVTSARARGVDAAIEAQLSQIRNQAEIVFSSQGCYNNDQAGAGCGNEFLVGACQATAGTIFAAPAVTQMITNAGNLSLTDAGIGRGTCVESLADDAWAVSMPLKSTPTDSWCVDSLGTSKLETGLTGAASFSGTKCN